MLSIVYPRLFAPFGLCLNQLNGSLRRMPSSGRFTISGAAGSAVSSLRAYQLASGIAEIPWSTTLSRIVQAAVSASVSKDLAASWKDS